MKKQLLATNIDGLLIKPKAFVEPHKAWFKRVIKKTKNNSLKKWIGRKDYFIGVNKAMDQLMPKASKNAKTTQARKWYQSDVVQYIKNHPSCIYKSRAKKLTELKTKYKLILITTNTQEYIGKILRAAKLIRLYDGVITSKTKEEPRKADLIGRLVKKYGKPDYYLTGKSEPEIISKFKKLGTRIVSASKLESL